MTAAPAPLTGDVDNDPRSRFPPWRDWSPALVIATIVVLVLAVALTAVTVGHRAIDSRRQRDRDHAAQQNLRDSYTAARVIYTDTQTYRAATPQQLQVVEPRLRFLRGPSRTFTEVSVLNRPDGLILAVRSRTGSCWSIRTADSGRTEYGTIGGDVCDATGGVSEFRPKPF